jgi:FimV C-terminal domain
LADTFAGLDFNLDFEPQEMPAVESPAVSEPKQEEPVMQPETASHDDMLNFDFDLDKPEMDLHEEQAPAAESAPAAELAEAPMSLDFSGINLDFDAPVEASANAAETALSDVEQEVKTKLDLAQVYQEMGDQENAREILQEVIKEGNAQQQESARELLNQLG